MKLETDSTINVCELFENEELTEIMIETMGSLVGGLVYYDDVEVYKHSVKELLKHFSDPRFSYSKAHSCDFDGAKILSDFRDKSGNKNTYEVVLLPFFEVSTIVASISHRKLQELGAMPY